MASTFSATLGKGGVRSAPPTDHATDNNPTPPTEIGLSKSFGAGLAVPIRAPR